MIIIVPRGKRFVSRMRGRINRQVVCESCGCNFQYSFYVASRGTGDSPMYADNEGAAMKAKAEAQAQFIKLAEHKSAPAPCPKCLHIQAAMKRRVWLHQIVPMYVFAAIATALGVLAYFSERETVGPIRPAAIAPYLLPGLLLLAVGLVLYVVKFKVESPGMRQRAIRRYGVKVVETVGG